MSTLFVHDFIDTKFVFKIHQETREL